MTLLRTPHLEVDPDSDLDSQIARTHRGMAGWAGGAEGWRWAGMPEPRPLYRLPEVLRADRVLVVEGEKAADAAPEVAGVTGEYFYESKLHKPTVHALNDADGERLWQISAELAA